VGVLYMIPGRKAFVGVLYMLLERKAFWVITGKGCVRGARVGLYKAYKDYTNN